MSRHITPLKALGQHFLKEEAIADRIAQSLSKGQNTKVLEIGPGTGILTSALIRSGITDLYCIEVDDRSVEYLKQHFPALSKRILLADFLQTDLSFMGQEPFRVIGNFPYNISSQILFRVLDHYRQVTELVGMFQKEVAVRVASGPGNRDYGILSVLLQAYYDIEYLFTVPPAAFDPPPKVDSGVIRMVLKENPGPGCDPVKFKTVVKTAFNQRRKTLRNSIRSLATQGTDHLPFMTLRPEALDHHQFTLLTLALFPESHLPAE
jgi:16S rRNA (adenine1518-N6/adenine1519-N6)-dimethyltransferase